MSIQDLTNGSQSHSFTAVAGEGNMPKLRKQYTMTKLRERWTEEEHKRFLEALKLYGRAWRKIEEHVGTKTAVQIRSHAQKFFSKMVRESSNGSRGSIKRIEIPPPRPKRKPMHPYPRKLVLPPEKGVAADDPLPRSMSPNSSGVEQENQSPISVLSLLASDTIGSADSNTENGCASPVSCATDINHDVSMLTEDMQGENLSQSDGLVSVKLELFPLVEDYIKQSSVEATSMRCLKLFGKTVMVPDSHKRSSPSHSAIYDVGEDLKQHPSIADDISGNCENSWDQEPCGMIPPVCFMNRSSNALEDGSASVVPWSFYGSLPFPLVPFDHTDIKNESLGRSLEDVRDKEVQKEGSWAGSDVGSVNALGNGDRNSDAKAQAHRGSSSWYKEVKGFSPYVRSNDARKSASSEKPVRGFVPYIRFTPGRDTQSSTISVEQKERHRTWLCL